MSVLTSIRGIDVKFKTESVAHNIFKKLLPGLISADEGVTEGLLHRMVYMTTIDREVVVELYTMLEVYLKSSLFRLSVLPTWSDKYRQLVLNVMSEIYDLCIL